MTAKAIPPPNPMQSLRARLIQEGSIIPRQENAAIDELVDSSENRINRFIIFSSGNICPFEKILLKICGESEISACIYLSIIRLLNLHKNLENSNLENLLKNQNKGFRSFLVLRDGFFFAFKENMRNTP